MTLNPFSSLPPPDSGSEQIVQAKPAALDEAVEKAYKVYEGLDFGQVPDQVTLSLEDLEKQILNPSQIDHLLQIIISETEPEKLNHDKTGLYLTKLIQDSYDAGNNGFVLTTGDNLIHSIGQEILGNYRRRLRLQIDGDVGDGCVLWARYIEVTISGNAGNNCGSRAENSKITVFGNVDTWCGQGAEKSNFNLFGNVGIFCGYDADHTVFTTNTKQTYDILKKSVPKRGGNTIKLVNSTGRIIRRKRVYDT